MILTAFTISGISMLVLNSIQDLISKHVDDRRNWFMLGIAIMSLLPLNLSLWVSLAILGGTTLMFFILMRYSKIGAGDLSAFNWINLGLFGVGIINLLWFWFFMGIFILGISLYNKKHNQETALYPFILISFIACLFMQ